MSAIKYCRSCGQRQSDAFQFCMRCGEPLSRQQQTQKPDAPDIPKDDMRNQILSELEELKSMAAAFGIERIRDGTWFNEFLRSMLVTYAERIIAGGGIAFFQAKYPGLSRDQIAEKLCDLAKQYASIAGGISGAAASAAFAATIGTAGGASVIAVPAGVLAVTAELLYTTRLQIRLVYDLSTIYGYPINLSDPEDLYKVFSMAYGVAYVAGSAGSVAKLTAPELARAQLRLLIQGNTAAIQQVAIRVLGPRLGREITQRAILRTAVPVVGVGISASWNYFSTEAIAHTARYGLRAAARIRDAAREILVPLADEPTRIALVLESVLTIILADNTFHQREMDLFNYIVTQLNIPPDVLERVEAQFGIHRNTLERRLQVFTSPETRDALARCLQLAAVADGNLSKAESAELRRLLPAIGHSYDAEQLEIYAQTFRAPQNWVDSVGKAVTEAGSNINNTIRGWFGWNSPSDDQKD